MKKLMTLLVVAIVCTTAAKAQVSISVNIGKQPVWGPVGYDHVDYYYLPEADMYYYVPDRVYIYRAGNTWRRTTVLPPRYKTIDLYQTHKVVINGVNKPYLNHAKYKREYAPMKERRDQVAIRDSREEKYWENKNHPQHPEWAKNHPDNGRDNGRGKGNGNGKGRGRGHQ